VLATAVAAVLAYVALYSTIRPELQPIRSDGYCYYVYLPSWIVYHDVSFDALARDWYGGTFPQETALRRSPVNRWLNPCPIGTALLMSPFVVSAHLLTYWSNLPPDGFSLYYQHGAGLAGVAYFLAGLAIVAALLCRHFPRGVVLATLVCLTWGTNLFHYGVFDSTFSHAFSFFLISIWLFVVEQWWRAATWRRSLALAVVAALIVLVRPPNAIFLVVLPLYGVASWRDLTRRGHELWQRRGTIAAVVVGAMTLVSPQVVLYRWASGSWFASPYAQLGFGFRFSSPHLFGVLASTQKGLFFWSPVLLLAVAGAAVASGWARQVALAASVAFALDLYVIASWSEWQFGASFGHRAFTDGLALAAPFIAAVFEWSARRMVARAAVAVFASCAVLLSIAQMLQYWIGVLPMEDTTWTQYRDLFLRFR
jgi:hypothetical protein